MTAWSVPFRSDAGVPAVAKKRVVGSNTPDKIRQKLAAKDPTAALTLAKRHYLNAPRDPEAIHLLRTCTVAMVDQLLAAGRTAVLAQLLAEVDNGMFLDAEWVRQLATWHAKAGNPVRAFELAVQTGDAALRAQVVGHAADAAIRAKSSSALPADLHAGYTAVVEGFEKYKLGHDNAARERLNDIGLTSPFLEWKLLLRGFLAFTANDDDGAKANWGRLSADRLPAKLVAPYRARIDPDAPTTGDIPLPSDPSSLAGRLKAVQANIGKGRNLSAAFKALESALPFVKTKMPAAVPRLANVMYHAIGRAGQPDDLSRYRRLFGAPADDPDFNKLQGRVLEEIGELRTSLEFWTEYDKWLSGPPASWPGPLARRARATIQLRMSEIAEDIGEEGEGSPFDDLFGFFSGGGRGRPGMKPARQKPPDPAIYLKKAVELAPDWEAPAVQLFDVYAKTERESDAEATARAFLARVPGSVPMLRLLAITLAGQGRAADALDLWRKALAANPLDRVNRMMFGLAVVGEARRLGIDGKPAEAEQLLAAEADTCTAEAPIASMTLRSVLARKAGRKDEADQLAEAAVARPGGRLAARLHLHANAVLLKVKPADKTAASKALTAALAETPTPQEAFSLYHAWDQFFESGLTYTGQKTQEKKIQAVVLAAAGGDGPEEDFEMLCEGMVVRRAWRLLGKLAPPLAKRFKTNPVFPLMVAEAETDGGTLQTRPYKVTKWLADAKRLAADSPHERHKKLLPRIDDLTKMNNPFEMLFDPFD